MSTTSTARTSGPLGHELLPIVVVKQECQQNCSQLRSVVVSAIETMQNEPTTTVISCKGRKMLGGCGLKQDTIPNDHYTQSGVDYSFEHVVDNAISHGANPLSRDEILAIANR